MRSMTGHNNYRLLRIANELCSCELTDGFCAPQNKPDCRCWRLAQLSVQGLRKQSDPCLADAWAEVVPSRFETNELERRSLLLSLCTAIASKEDELTERFRHEMARD